MGQLAIQKTNDVTPWGETPTLFVDLILSGQRANHPYGYELAKLVQDNSIMFGWFWTFFHTDFLGRKSAKANHFFNYLDHPYGMAVFRTHEYMKKGHIYYFISLGQISLFILNGRYK